MTRNWGRWGHDDERGALNLITPEHVLSTLQIPIGGRVYVLSEPIQSQGVPIASDGGPPIHLFSRDGGDYAAGLPADMGRAHADDYLMIRCHGHTTHLDSLGHVWSGDRIYNGFSSDSIRSTGMAHCGIEQVGAIVTRGVLLDIAGHHEVQYLAGGEVITRQDILSCARAEGVEIRAGDAVLLNTGWRSKFDEDPEAYLRSRPGLGVDGADWLAEQDVALVGADTLAVESFPYDSETTMSPVHQLLLRDAGIYLLELLRLEQIAAEQVYEFMFVAVPLRIVGGTGSPLSPIAIA